MSKAFDNSPHGNKLELSMNDNGENDSKLVNSPQTTANEFTLLNNRTDCDLIDDDSIEPCIQSFSTSPQASIKFNAISNNNPASHKTVDCARDLASPDVNSTQCFQSPNQSSSKTPVQLKSEQSNSVLNNYVFKSNHNKDNNHSDSVYNDNNGNETRGPAKHLVHWFRKGLRLHDQPALLKGLQGCDTFRCIYLIDPWFSTESNCGINKWRFLLQSLEDLDSNLHKLGSRLFVIRGQPAEVFPLLFKEWMITHLSFEEDPEPFGKIRDAKIAKMCKEMNIEVICETSHTLYRLEDIINHCSGEIPLTYLQFQNVISELGKPEEPAQAITHEIIGKAYTPVPRDHAKKYTVPTLNELGFTTQPNHRSVWVGGETEALQRLSRHLEHKAWVATFGKPKLTSLSLLCASQTGLGPYLR